MCITDSLCCKQTLARCKPTVRQQKLIFKKRREKNGVARRWEARRKGKRKKKKMKEKKPLEPSGTVSRSCDLRMRRPAGALFGLVKEGAILRVLGINVPVNVTRRQVALNTTGTSAKRQASQPPPLGTTFRVWQRLPRGLGSPRTR